MGLPSKVALLCTGSWVVGSRIIKGTVQHLPFFPPHLHTTQHPPTQVSGRNKNFFLPEPSKMSYLGTKQHKSQMYCVLPNTTPVEASLVTKYGRPQGLQTQGNQQQKTPQLWVFSWVTTTFDLRSSLVSRDDVSSNWHVQQPVFSVSKLVGAGPECWTYFTPRQPAAQLLKQRPTKLLSSWIQPTEAKLKGLEPGSKLFPSATIQFMLGCKQPMRQHWDVDWAMMSSSLSPRRSIVNEGGAWSFMIIFGQSWYGAAKNRNIVLLIRLYAW